MHNRSLMVCQWPYRAWPRSKKRKTGAGYQWFTPVILATQEAEIRRIVVQSQPQANSSQDPISKKTFTKKDWWGGSRCRP
jgi:hypothetical protein